MAFDAGAIVGRIEIDSKQAVGALRRFARETTKNLRASGARFTAFVKQNEQGFKRLGQAVTAFGLGVVAAFGMAVKTAVDFERAMRNVNAIARLSEKAFEQTNEEVIRMAQEVGAAPKVLAEGLYDIVSSGFQAADAMKVLAAAARAGVAGLSDTATAAKAITAILNAYAMTADDATRVSDILFKTVERGVITFGLLATNLGQIISIGAQAKVPIEELTAAIATMTRSGVQAEEATTSLGQVMLSFIKPTDQAKDAAKDLGIDLSATALATDGLIGSIVKMAEALGTSGDELDDMVKAGTATEEIMALVAKRAGTTTERMAELFPNVRALRGALVLASGGAKEVAEDLKAMGEAGGATAAAFKEMAKSFAVQWAKLKATIQGLLIAIGKQLLPILTPLIERIAEAGKAAAAWMKEHPGLTKAIIALVAALGAVALAIGPLLLVLPTLISSFAAIAPIVAAAGSALAAIGAGPIAVVIAAVGALGAAVYLLIKHWDVVKPYFQKLWAFLEDLFGDTLRDIRATMQEVGNDILVLTREIWPEVKATIAEVWEYVGPLVKAVVGGMLLQITVVWKAIALATKVAWFGIRETFEVVWASLKLIIKHGADFIKTTMAVINAIIALDWQKAWNLVVDCIRRSVNRLKSYFAEIREAAKDSLIPIANLLVGILTRDVRRILGAVAEIRRGFAGIGKAAREEAAKTAAAVHWFGEEYLADVDEQTKTVTETVTTATTKVARAVAKSVEELLRGVMAKGEAMYATGIITIRQLAEAYDRYIAEAKKGSLLWFQIEERRAELWYQVWHEQFEKWLADRRRILRALSLPAALIPAALPAEVAAAGIEPAPPMMTLPTAKRQIEIIEMVGNSLDALNARRDDLIRLAETFRFAFAQGDISAELLVAALANVKAELRAMGPAGVEAARELEEGIKKAADGILTLGQVAERVFHRLGDVLGNFFEKVLEGTASMRDALTALRSILARVIADIIAAGVMGQIGRAIGLPKITAQFGAIVTRPTLALVGERGPEAIVPLDQAGGIGDTFQITINAVDAQSVASLFMQHGSELASGLANAVRQNSPATRRRFR